MRLTQSFFFLIFINYFLETQRPTAYSTRGILTTPTQNTSKYLERKLTACFITEFSRTRHLNRIERKLKTCCRPTPKRGYKLSQALCQLRVSNSTLITSAMWTTATRKIIEYRETLTRQRRMLLRTPTTIFTWEEFTLFGTNICRRCTRTIRTEPADRALSRTNSLKIVSILVHLIHL